MTFDALTAFEVVGHLRRTTTTYDVLDRAHPGQPVAQLRSNADYDSRRPLQLFSGAALDQPAGWVSGATAVDAKRSALGTVGCTAGDAFTSDRWAFEQNDLPPMLGEPADLLRRTPLNLVSNVVNYLGDGLADLTGLRLRFRAEGSDGFELTRSVGPMPRYAVEIADERISRLLVLALVVRFDAQTTDLWDPRKLAIDLTTNPFKD